MASDYRAPADCACGHEGHQRDADVPDLSRTLRVMAQLTSAQQALLRRIAAHAEPVTVTQLANESGLHPNSVRETLDALVHLGLVTCEQMPIRGRGRPALGYQSYTPADPAFPARMLAQVSHSMFTWLTAHVADPRQAAHEMGRYWADDALAMMHVPDHTQLRPSGDFTLAGHLNKMRLFLVSLGFAAQPHPRIDTGLVLLGCPFGCTDESCPDSLALEMRTGMVERVIERTASAMADSQIMVDVNHPLRCEIIFTVKGELADHEQAVDTGGGSQAKAEAS
ncbi:helix-turn-helix transcriptional regulator [Propionibacterium australiense]|uniref:Transcription regulator IclR-like n=1 Tax=Propionibacterium australiense TaxID=119981 RepID=A0A383S968_9ACTN|nr:helix-turn-helix domain-containing protein [Propionibacterium australiense]RLP07610.1 hypothetical protein D9T14_10035 [Propionibacterium australiense]RLP08380.1 hypothetical protein D7U36_09605 [Propionibacterium australiense]SYZ33964.1 Transcription regulator IclR-like [Propionibacterium australiense]VEH88941.1 Predicted transcriptional regulator [Propionibacterium australiense]